MKTVQDVCDFLELFAPTQLAEEWDNVGLIVGDPALEVRKIMTCLTITPSSANEAIENGVDLIVTHHPLPFQPLKRLTTAKTPSRLLWNLIRAGVSIYSPHTGFDSAPAGINQSLGERIGLAGLAPLIPADDESGPGVGAGRHGKLAEPVSLKAFAAVVKTSLGIGSVKVIGGADGLKSMVHHVAIACGSGGSFLGRAIECDCDTFLTGETTFHTCLEAESCQTSMVLTGHYASERFAVEMLADRLSENFPHLQSWASKKESDPVSVL